MVWACVTPSGNGLLVFSDDVTAESNSRMNSEVCKAILSAQSQLIVPKLVKRHVPGQTDNDANILEKQEFLKSKKFDIPQWPNLSPDFLQHVLFSN